MMTPGELCNATAKVLGFDATAVTIAWRILRQHGKVTTGGRGRSAAHCTASDAATLLIALLGKLPSKSLMESWEMYFNLRPYRTAQLLASPALVTTELDKLPSEHSFGEALTALIASANSGTLQRYVNVKRISIVRVRFEAPRPAAFIDAYQMKGRRALGMALKYVHLPDITDPLVRFNVVEEEFSHFALHQRSELDPRGVFALGELLRRPG